MVITVFPGEIHKFRFFLEKCCILFAFPDMITLKAFTMFLSKVMPALCVSAVKVLERIFSSKMSAQSKGTPKKILEVCLS